MSDPFDESATEVKGFVDQAKAALSRLKQLLAANRNDDADSNSATDDATVALRIKRAAVECRDSLDAAADELVLLRSVVNALKSGRVRHSNVTHQQLAAREDLVEDYEVSISTLKQQLQAAMPSSVHSSDSHSPSPVVITSSRAHAQPHPPDGAVRKNSSDERHQKPADPFLAQMEQQREDKRVHDAALDRIAVGLEGLKDKAVLIGGRLEEDEVELDAVMADVTSVQQRLHAAVYKVDQMLVKMSMKSRCGLLFTLLVLAALLLFLLSL